MKYKVSYRIDCMASGIVEADSMEEAIEIAQQVDGDRDFFDEEWGEIVPVYIKTINGRDGQEIDVKR